MFKDMVLEVRAKLTEMETQVDHEIQLAKDEGYAKGLSDGKAGGDADAKIYSQAEADKLAEDKVAAAMAALPADTTPFAQADVDAKVEEATAGMKEELAALKLSVEQKDAVEELIASSMKGLAEQVSALSPTVVAE